MVTVIDSKDVGHTNIPYVEEDTPICIESLKVHILCSETRFLLKERQFVPSRKDMRKEKETKPGNY